jgi:serine/threonine-protein kinase
MWVDRKGQETPIAAPPRLYAEPRLSPDGTRVAVGIHDQEQDVWIWDLMRETLTRLTFDRGVDDRPVDTGRPAHRFASERGGASDLFMQAADGTGAVERLTTGADLPGPAFVAPDGTASSAP